jgi:hypothetical protein
LKAIAELSRQIGIVSKAEYLRLAKAAEIARRDVLEAQVNLEAHIAAHGSTQDGDEEASA